MQQSSGIQGLCSTQRHFTVPEHIMLWQPEPKMVVQMEKGKFEGEARQRAGGNSSRYGEQEVCPLSGVIVNVEETRVRDHKMGRNYRWVCCGLQALARYRCPVGLWTAPPSCKPGPTIVSTC